MNLNKVFLIGRLTMDPQLRSTPSGQSVATLSFATNRVWTDKGGARREETEYHAVVVWGKQAEVANQFLTKGSLAFVEGRLQTRSWQDKQGQQRKTTEIIAERIQLGPRNTGGGASGKESRAPSELSQESPVGNEEMPVVDLDQESKPEELPF